jgi:hypothetical protein
LGNKDTYGHPPGSEQVDHGVLTDGLDAERSHFRPDASVRALVGAAQHRRVVRREVELLDLIGARSPIGSVLARHTVFDGARFGERLPVLAIEIKLIATAPIDTAIALARSKLPFCMTQSPRELGFCASMTFSSRRSAPMSSRAGSSGCARCGAVGSSDVTSRSPAPAPPAADG